MKKYPFKEGDDYYTIVGGDIVHSCGMMYLKNCIHPIESISLLKKKHKIIN